MAAQEEGSWGSGALRRQGGSVAGHGSVGGSGVCRGQSSARGAWACRSGSVVLLEELLVSSWGAVPLAPTRAAACPSASPVPACWLPVQRSRGGTLLRAPR